ncbi:BamA/TamA family outer membrane protein [Shewanella sp. NIFS-20-20]|uniref:BamA/TamA family outer membrane protein n=1 Tax=Shewanella sp. NIFS-20-20 TaxID=2853806 RepID=UPI001C49181F|nr:BamA/TamA family outer membrane protein [Shewanella sp. NIFS-20-20]MBV7316238.1 BamA/TamA family outer membrane protein [Shewanella sp. NIFS-20-20]
MLSVAVSPGVNADWLDDLLTDLGGSEQVDLSQGIDWGVLPGPFVNPVQGFGIGVAAIGLYSPPQRQPEVQLSTLSVKSFVSSSGSYGIGVENRSYFADDTWRMGLDAWLSHSPRDYWGIGRAAASDSANQTAYDGQVFELSPSVSYRLVANTYVQLGWEYQSVTGLSATGPALSTEQLQDARTSGLSVSLAYDSRDFAPNPERGSLLELKYLDYGRRLGSDFDFSKTAINLRHYHRIDASHILAVEVYGEGAHGDVPWFELPQLGSDARMRGYYQGQYRDNYYLSSQVELRQSLTPRHGFVYWLGAGNVAGDWSGLFKQTWLPSIGVGYRLAFKERVNIRLDVGIGKDSSGVYFHINEAF